jgi:putative membrane protein insertion efficiency factor
MRVLSRLACAAIHVYRYVLSPLWPGTCRYQPTCSAYALQAIARFGAGRGGWLSLRRLLRCHPWGGAGVDPVPAADGGRRLPVRPDALTTRQAR